MNKEELKLVLILLELADEETGGNSHLDTAYNIVRKMINGKGEIIPI